MGYITLNTGLSKKSVTLSNGNLTATSTASNSGAAGLIPKISGKWYFEFQFSVLTDTASGVGIRIQGSTYAGLTTPATLGAMVYKSGNYWVNGSSIANVGGVTTANVIGVAVDLDNKKIWFRVDGGNWNSNASYDPATNTGGTDISAFTPASGVYPAVCFGNGTDAGTFNFGATSFAHTAPSGFGGWTDTVDAKVTVDLDSGAVAANNSNVSSITATLPGTDGIDRVVICCVHNDGKHAARGTRETATITSPHLTWTRHKELDFAGISSGSDTLELWWAPAASQLSSAEVITATFSDVIDGASMVVFAVAGANTGSPFDTNGSIPATNSSTGSAAASVTGISTTSTDGLLIGAYGNDSGPTSPFPAIPIGFGIAGRQNNNSPAEWSDIDVWIKSFKSALSSAAVTSATSETDWGMIGTVIACAPALSGTWASTETKDAMAFIERPHGNWASTETKDAMAFIEYPNGNWASTEAPDVTNILGGIIGPWHSTETKDAMAFTGGVLGGSWHSTEAKDAMEFTGRPELSGVWSSIEITDAMTAVGLGSSDTFFDPTTASPGIDFQALDLTVINQEAFGQPVGAKSNTTHSSGKFYAEFITRLGAANSGVGIGNASATFENWGNPVAYGLANGPAANGAGIFVSLNGTIWINGVEQSNWPGVSLNTWPNGSNVRVAVDLDNQLIWFSVNGGHWNGIAGANPANGIASPRPPSNQPQVGSGGYDISAIAGGGPVYLWAELVNAYDAVTMNPGDSAFTYSVPAGFSAWDSAPPISSPLQMDGYATSGVNGGPITSGTVTLSTTQDNDVIVLGINTGGFWDCSDVDHITSTSGLVWKRRNKRWQSGGYKHGGGTVINQGLDTEVWWAHAPVALTNEVITVHATSGTGAMGLIAFGVSGANYTMPWDTHTQAGGFVDNVGNLYYFPPTASLYTKAQNAFLFGFHSDTATDAGVTRAPWTYVAAVRGTETSGYAKDLSLVYQIVEEPQFNTDVVAGYNVAGIGTCYTAQNMMFDSIVAVGETGTDREIVWFWDPDSVSNIVQLSTGTTLQLSYSATNYNLMVLIEVAIMSASGNGEVTSISESQGSLSSTGFERRSRKVTSTPLGPLAVEIWWGWMPMYTDADRPNNDTITINTAHTQAGDLVGAIILGLHGATGAFGLGDPFWDVNPAVPAMNGNNSGSPPPYATDISTTIPSDLVVAWTANNSANVPGFTDPFVTLLQDYPRTIVPKMQLNSVAPPFFTGFEFYYEPGLATSETAEFLQAPEPDGWIVIADAIPVGPPQPPSGTMHISDQQDRFTHTGDYTGIGIASPGGWVGAPENHGVIAAVEHEDINGGTPNLGYPPFLGEGWLGWVPANAEWHSTEGYGDTMALYGWVLGFGITGQLGAVENKDRLAFSNRAAVTGTMSAVGAKDRFASAGLVLPPGRIHPKNPTKRRLLIIT